MAKLTAAARRALPTSAYAGPGRTFPVNDKKHARAAIMLSRYAPDPAAVKAKAERVLGAKPSIVSAVGGLAKLPRKRAAPPR